jgi:carboxyl-terminal processing protease
MKAKTKIKLFFIIKCMSIMLLTACGSSKSPPPPPPPPPVSWYADVVGTWKQQGYGNVIEISELNYSLYQVNEVSCIKQGSWSLDSLDADLKDKQKNTALDHLTLEYSNNDTLQRFDKETALPVLCENDGTQISNDPEFNFDSLWNTFSEQYAFFNERDVNWNDVYGTYRQQVNNATTDEALFLILSEMLSLTKDGHINLISDNDTFKAGALSMVTQRIYDEFANQSDVLSIEEYINQQLTIIDGIILGYLDGEVAQGANERLAWGKLSSSVGYLMVRQMTDFAQNANENTSDLENLQALQPVIENAMAQLADTQALVIDLRLNGGGQVKSALEIASYFVQQTTPAFTVKAKFDNAFTERQTINIVPSDSSVYSGKVIILTSGLTASASEIFILTMLERGQVTLVGETTEGIFSNQLNKQLPNGWSFTLSNEVYQNIQGTVFEVAGILPDTQQVIFPFSDRTNGIDGALDKAIELLGNQGIY